MKGYTITVRHWYCTDEEYKVKADSEEQALDLAEAMASDNDAEAHTFADSWELEVYGIDMCE